MKKLISRNIICIFIILLFFTACVTVQETLYLRQAEVSGSMISTPIHLTDSTETPSITLSPRFSYNTKENLVGDVENSSTYYTTDSAFVPAENSLNWDISRVNAGLDMDIAVTRTFALSLGINYSSSNNFSKFGGNAGIGFLSYKNGLAFRLGLGITINSMRYDAYTVIRRVTTSWFGNSDEYIGFYHDVGESTHFDPYLNLTFNTAFKNWPLNIFINAGYVMQTLFSFKPKKEHTNNGFGSYTKTDLRGSSTAGFINITPGIYFYLGDSNRALIALRIYREVSINNSSPNLFIYPMVQFDFRL